MVGMPLNFGNMGAFRLAPPFHQESNARNRHAKLPYA